MRLRVCEGDTLTVAVTDGDPDTLGLCDGGPAAVTTADVVGSADWDGRLVRLTVVEAVGMGDRVPDADTVTDADWVGLPIGLRVCDGEPVDVRLAEPVRVGLVVVVIDLVGGGDSVGWTEAVAVGEGALERDASGLADADLDPVVVRLVVGLADAVLEADVVGVIERVATAEMVRKGLMVAVRDIVADLEAVPLLVAVRDRVGVRVAVAVGNSVRVPTGDRVGSLLINGERVPVGVRLTVRVAVTVRVGIADRVLVGEGIGVRVVVGERVAVHVMREVAEGMGCPAAPSARRFPSMPISASGQSGTGDPRTPAPSKPGGVNPVRHSKRRSSLILLWFIKQFLDGGGATEDPCAPEDCDRQ